MTVYGMILRALPLALLLTACDEGPNPPQRQGQAASADPRAEAALRAAEERLRARLRVDGPMMLRAVQVHRQAVTETLAVCGQINTSGRSDEPFIPYVAVVSFEEGQAPRADLHLAASNAEAARVYLEMVDRCWDGGGPPNARATVRPLPPIPNELPREVPAPNVTDNGTFARPAPQAAPAMPTVSPQIALPPVPADGGLNPGAVMTTSRHPVNIRATPGGGGVVMKVAPRGSLLQVHGEAPGGWLQVGSEGEVWGWLHSSMLEGR